MIICFGNVQTAKLVIPKEYYEAFNYIKSERFFESDSIYKSYLYINSYLEYRHRKDKKISFIVADSTEIFEFGYFIIPRYFEGSTVQGTRILLQGLGPRGVGKPDFIVFFSQMYSNYLVAKIFAWQDPDDENIQSMRGKDFRHNLRHYASFNESIDILFRFDEFSKIVNVAFSHAYYD
jgi:hypothetical protein